MNKELGWISWNTSHYNRQNFTAKLGTGEIVIESMHCF